jgi:hypothetical protein
MLFLQFIVLPHNYLLRNCYLQQFSTALRYPMLPLDLYPDQGLAQTPMVGPKGEGRTVPMLGSAAF